MPNMLEEALIQMVVGGTEYGQKGIADTIEILRKMRCEIGTEDLKEWVQRAFVLVQPKEILLGEMCESVEDTEDSNERVLVEGDCTEGNREDGLLDMWGNGEAGDTPQRREPNEQLAGELDLLMQKLSHEAAQKAVIMYCLRIACESEVSVSQALSTVQEGQAEAYTMKIRSGCDVDAHGKAAGKGALIQTEPLCIEMTSTKNTIVKNGICPTLTARMGTGGNQVNAIVEPVVALDRASYNQGQNAQFDFDCNDGGIASTIVAKGPGAVCYTVDQGGGKSACNVSEGQAPTLTCTHGGEPAICYSLDPVSSNSMKSSNPHSGCHETNVARTIDTTNPDPSKNQVGVAVVEQVYTIGNGQVDQTDLHEKAGTLNCMHDQQAVMIATRTRYTVRRLTPNECELLQGYPSGWTDIGEYTDTNGRKRKSSDANRYRALGNSIALPPWKWVMKRLCACYERDATLASLFDGIGGFPYIWEQINGKGSCLWASEIEEFPIAVTRVRIGE